jgi:hypothetical protein
MSKHQAVATIGPLYTHHTPMLDIKIRWIPSVINPTGDWLNYPSTTNLKCRQNHVAKSRTKHPIHQPWLRSYFGFYLNLPVVTHQGIHWGIWPPWPGWFSCSASDSSPHQMAKPQSNLKIDVDEKPGVCDVRAHRMGRCQDMLWWSWEVVHISVSTLWQFQRIATGNDPWTRWFTYEHG